MLDIDEFGALDLNSATVDSHGIQVGSAAYSAPGPRSTSADGRVLVDDHLVAQVFRMRSAARSPLVGEQLSRPVPTW